MPEPVAGEFEVTSSPVAALFSSVALITGVQLQDDGSAKVYVGPRYHGTYVVVGADQAAAMQQAWNGSSTTHLWMRPAPPTEALCVDVDAVKES